MFPVELAQTAVGAVIEADGTGLTVTLVEPLALHPLLSVTVTFKLTGLVPLALQVMLAVPAPAVIVPLLIVQL